MANSQFKAGYDFQHLIKEYFLELGFDTQEEQWETRTDIALTHAPLNFAVECKYYLDGVTPALVEEFDRRLKEWQRLGRPCLGVMVASSFQIDAQELCKQKNILYLTRSTLDNALTLRRSANELVSLKITKSVLNLLGALAGLTRAWLGFLYGDPVHDDILFWNSLVNRGYIESILEMSPKFYSYQKSSKGDILFVNCLKIYRLLLNEQLPKYTSDVQIIRCIKSVLNSWDEINFKTNDLILLIGLGLVEYVEGKYQVSEFGNSLLDISQYANGQP
jgi:hypothetical protein